LKKRPRTVGLRRPSGHSFEGKAVEQSCMVGIAGYIQHLRRFERMGDFIGPFEYCGDCPVKLIVTALFSRQVGFGLRCPARYGLAVYGRLAGIARGWFGCLRAGGRRLRLGQPEGVEIFDVVMQPAGAVWVLSPGD